MICRLLIGILAASNLALAGADDASFPAVSDLKSVQFSLEHGHSIFGGANYKLQINGDGLVTWEGEMNVAVTGQRKSHISGAAVRELLESFRQADVFALRDNYYSGNANYSTCKISFTIGKRIKTIMDYDGARIGMPQVVTDLEKALDAAAGSQRWIKGKR